MRCGLGGLGGGDAGVGSLGAGLTDFEAGLQGGFQRASGLQPGQRLIEFALRDEIGGLLAGAGEPVVFRRGELQLRRLPGKLGLGLGDLGLGHGKIGAGSGHDATGLLHLGLSAHVIRLGFRHTGGGEGNVRIGTVQICISSREVGLRLGQLGLGAGHVGLQLRGFQLRKQRAGLHPIALVHGDGF